MRDRPHPDALPPSQRTQPAERYGSDVDGGDDSYLLVFERSSSWVHRLPEEGEVLIGRGPTAVVRLAEASISREHAKVVLGARGARLEDLGSQNGTLLNGETVAEPRLLASGDTIGLSHTTLVFHAGTRHRPMQGLVDFAQFRERAAQELERALRSNRPWSVLALHLGENCPDPDLGLAALGRHLRAIDLVAWDGARRILVLLPETGPASCRLAAQRLLEAIGATAPETRVGYAAAPNDGCDLDPLLASARAAAAAAASGTVAAADGAFEARRVGEAPLIIADPAMAKLFGLVERLAAASIPVLVLGETGTGKELVAAALHHWSDRQDGPLMTVDCATIAEQHAESELFGCVRGAFPGADEDRPGLIERANGGTLILDEVAALPVPVQTKLVRLLETHHLRPLGDVAERAVDVRYVAATNRDLEAAVRSGAFQKDLYFRLRGATVWIPPLRDRPRELPILAKSFLEAACASASRPPVGLSVAALRELATYTWPGNVRELKSFLEYQAYLGSADVVDAGALSEWLSVGPGAGEAGVPGEFRPIKDELRDLERERMVAALVAAKGNQTRAAELIRMPVRTFIAKVKHYGLQNATTGRAGPRSEGAA